MLPVYPYRYHQRYPPKESIWPRFGPDVLGETLSVSQEAQQTLMQKRQLMDEFHQDNLQYHRLAARKNRLQAAIAQQLGQTPNGVAPSAPSPAPQQFNMTDNDAPMEEPLRIMRREGASLPIVDPPRAMNRRGDNL